MVKNEITLVTAFFDIGRGELDNEFLRRSASKYMSDFARWARMKNRLIVYTERKFEKEILRIRERYGLLDRTKVICVTAVFNVEPEIYEGMCKVERDERFRAFRYYENAYSNTAKYDYIMLMKYWALQDACRNHEVQTKGVAWIDFGYDHGGVTYPYSEEFSFLWKYDFSDKIQIFCLNDPDRILGADSLQFSYDCMIGGLIYVPTDWTEKFWLLMKNNMEALLSLGCIDDDQQLLLMAYKREPEWFEVHRSDWFLPLKEYGGEHLTVCNKSSKKSIKQKIRGLGKGLLSSLGIWRSNQKDFAKRSYARVKKYYPY